MAGAMCLGLWGSAFGQTFEVVDSLEKGNFNSVWTRGFWHNWFVQVDLDMSLQNPYGYDFSKVFPNGKSFENGGENGGTGTCFTNNRSQQ